MTEYYIDAAIRIALTSVEFTQGKQLLFISSVRAVFGEALVRGVTIVSFVDSNLRRRLLSSSLEISFRVYYINSDDAISIDLRSITGEVMTDSLSQNGILGISIFTKENVLHIPQSVTGIPQSVTSSTSTPTPANSINIIGLIVGIACGLLILGCLIIAYAKGYLQCCDKRESIIINSAQLKQLSFFPQITERRLSQLPNTGNILFKNVTIDLRRD